MPDDIRFYYKQTPRPAGPFGSGGASECFQCCGHMSVVNAIADAVGVRINDLPATPERVRTAMEAKARGEEPIKEPFYLGDPMDEVLEDIAATPVPEVPFKPMTVEEMMIGD